MSRPADFNRLARLYRWMEIFSFGPWLALTRSTFLNRLTGSRRALVLGDGDGRFCQSLLRVNAMVRIDAVDASTAMLAALLRRAGRQSSRVRTQLADIRTWKPLPGAPPYDLIATHFFLDCLTTPEVQRLARDVRQAAGPQALWVVSDFAIPEGWRGHFFARPVVQGLYFCFGVLTGLAVRTLPDHALALRDAGFSLVERRTPLGGLLIAELWSCGVRVPGLTPADSSLSSTQ